MSFTSKLEIYGDTCDKCERYLTVESPGIEMRVSFKRMKDRMIWLHIDCLLKIITKHRAESIEKGI
jgi:hypothetical protein